MKTLLDKLFGLKERPVILAASELRYHARVAPLEVDSAVIGQAHVMTLSTSTPGLYIGLGAQIIPERPKPAGRVIGLLQ